MTSFKCRYLRRIFKAPLISAFNALPNEDKNKPRLILLPLYSSWCLTSSKAKASHFEINQTIVELYFELSQTWVELYFEI